MKWSLFLPDEFSYCKDLEPKQIVDELTRSGIDLVVRFFVGACTDETWVKETNGVLMGPLFSFLSNKYREGELRLHLAQEVARAIQKHYPTLQHYLEFDRKFLIEGKEIPIKSLMFSATSDFFRSLIGATDQETIPVKEVTVKRFEHVREFIYFGTIDLLYREEPKEILDLIRLAARWNMEDLAAYAAFVYKRYLSPENIQENLELAEKVPLPQLKKECCHFMTSHAPHLSFHFLEDATVQVDIAGVHFTDLEVLDIMQPYISSVKIIGSSGIGDYLIPFFKKLTHLDRFDASGTSGIEADLIAELPPTTQLDLAECSWLDDISFSIIVEKSPKVTHISLRGNNQLTFRSAGILSNFARIGFLDLSHTSIESDGLDLISVSCPSLSEVNLSNCSALQDEGIVLLVQNCPQLLRLHLAKANNISEEGWVNLATYARSLEYLDARQSTGVTDSIFKEMLKTFPQVKTLLVTGCPLTLSVIKNQQQIYPHITIVF